MINNVIDSGKRAAKIDLIDKLLVTHETEYHYIFKKLYEFESD
jgi:hypothetical protein